ncbi:MAG TPA: TolC family outer membrane protein [Methylophilaceae bacterium]|nr:TolC family outer membrane protein [Methylophilaceae bacterium]
MKRPIRGIACLSLTALFAIPQAQAAEDLLSLYRKALQYDAQYRAAVANTAAEREEINKTRALFMPKLQASANVGHGTTDRTTQTALGALDSHLNYDIQNYALSIRQPLFNKESMAAYRSAKANAGSKEELLRREDSVLMTRIASAYFETLYAQEKVAVTQNKIAAVQQQLQQAQQRYEHGEGTITEINEAQAVLKLAQAELIDAHNSLDDFRQTLANITGQPIADLAALDIARIPTAMPGQGNLDEWLDQALRNNPEIAAARLALDAARQEVERRRAGHYPTLDLVGVRSYSENDSNNTIGSQFDTTTVALQLNLPLYAGGYTSASVRQAQDRLTAAEEILNLRTRNITADTRKFFNSIHSGLLSIEAYRQAVEAGEIALEGTQKGFVAGTRTNVDVLDAQMKLYASKLELSKARYILINDILNIKQAAGLLNEAELQAINRFFVSNGS